MFKKVKIIFVIVLFAAFIFLASKYGFGLNGSEAVEVTLKGERFTVEVADTPAEHMQGLSGRNSLADNGGMFFIFDKPDTYGFWMKDMKFSIDIIWINGDEVVYVTRDLNPNSYPSIFSSPSPADKVLEVKAGTAERLNIVGGDNVSVGSVSLSYGR